MPTETFTVDEFSKVLEDAGYQYDKLGWIQGEYCFAVDLGKQVSIRIRSSIHSNGHAAESGSDSIRLWLCYQGEYLCAKNLPDGINVRWIQRTENWQARLTLAIEKLRFFYQSIGTCVCGKPRKVFGSPKPQYKGVLFTKCVACETWGPRLNADAIMKQAVLPMPSPEPTQAEKNFRASLKTTMLESSDLPMLGANVTSPINSNGESGEKGMFVPSIGNGSNDNGYTVNSDGMDADDNSTQPMEPVSTVSVESGSLATGLSFLSDVPALTVEPEEPKAKAFTPSKYQSAIFDFVKSESSNAVVEAVAGSGKTETLVRSLQFTSENLKVGFVAFNKHIAVELQKRAPEHVHVSTLHSLGYANLRKMLGNQAKVDDRKLWHIFDEMTDGLPEMVKRDIQQDASTMIRLVNLCKGTLREPNQENIDYLCDRYGIEVNGHKDSIYDFVGKMWHRSFSNLTTIDYEDMIFASAYGICPCEKFDVLFIDEGQDLNKAQIEMSLKSGSRIVVVADRRQSIYGFRGADTEAVPNMIRAIDAKLLPLSISYRCPKSVVELAKTIVPQIEYREDAPDGKIDEITEYQFNHQVQNGDLVLCRTNAPLIKPCFDLIRRGVKATIRGRDIGSGLIQLLEKHAKREGTANLKMLLYSLDEYVQNESSKLIAANKGTRAQSLQDQFETLLALSDGCYQVSEVKSKVARIFSDEQAAVTFSSVHRSKGDESNRVFILHPELLPHPLAKQSWEQMQESNLKYVAITRSKSELYWVTK